MNERPITICLSLSQSVHHTILSTIYISLLSFKHFSSYFPKVSCLFCHSICKRDGEKIIQKSHPDMVLIFLRTRTQKTIKGAGTIKQLISGKGNASRGEMRRLRGKPVQTFSSCAFRQTSLKCESLFPQEWGSGFGKYVFFVNNRMVSVSRRKHEWVPTVNLKHDSVSTVVMQMQILWASH